MDEGGPTAMNLLTGLSPEQEELVKRSGALKHYGPGEVIFHEGDPAEGLYVILNGSIEVYRTDTGGEDHRLNLLRSGEVLGEMGLLTDIERRTASARTAEPTELLYLDGNPIKALKRVGSPEASLTLFKNLARLLGDRLGEKDRGIHPIVVDPVTHYRGQKSSPAGAMHVIEDALPGGPLRSFLHQRVLKPGTFLFHYYDEVDGFYLLTTGEMEAVRERGEHIRPLGKIQAPALIGEVAFFARRARSASIRATEESKVAHFTKAAFEKLEKNDPERAANVLFAVVELMVGRIVQRENE